MDVAALRSALGTPAGLLAVAVLALAAYIIYKYMYSPYQYLKSIGIPGPTPIPFIGNLHQSSTLLTNFHTQLCAQYGKTCGFYAGTTPFIVTTDPEMVKQITIKNFKCFEDRVSGGGLLRFNVDGTEVPALAAMNGEQWRTVRHALTPAFTAHKMKPMGPMILASSKLLKDKLEAGYRSGQSLNMTELYKKLSLEMILAVAFGREVRVQAGESDELYQQAKKLIRSVTRPPIFKGQLGAVAILDMVNVARYFGWLQRLIEPLTQFGQSKAYLTEASKKLRDARKSENGHCKKNDLLQVMLDAVEDKKMADHHSVMMSVVTLIAGHEPITNAIVAISFLLATHQEVQQRLIEEIRQYFNENPDKSHYEAAQEMEYLDQVYHESLRMYSPASLLLRKCTTSCEVNGYHIKEGTSIIAAIPGLHYDKEQWTEPEKFDPDRFSKENKANHHPCAYVPFGAGPRACIGMRLSILHGGENGSHRHPKGVPLCSSSRD